LKYILCSKYTRELTFENFGQDAAEAAPPAAETEAPAAGRAKVWSR
jgi:hypothetical protein